MIRVVAAFLISVALVSSGPVTAATAGGAEIHWESKGNGPALVFIHGVLRDMSDWANQVAQFEDDYRVITLDLPGYGQSGTPTEEGENSLSHFAEAVEAVRAEAGIDQMVLVGHSLGGFVIGEYVMLYPEHVAGIVAADSQFHGPRDPVNPRDPSIVFTATITRDDSIESPALLVWGGNSNLLKGFQEDDVQRLYPHGRVAMMPNVGHDVMLENPAEFNRLLREFLQEIAY